jgi:hypothetical protein
LGNMMSPMLYISNSTINIKNYSLFFHETPLVISANRNNDNPCRKSLSNSPSFFIFFIPDFLIIYIVYQKMRVIVNLLTALNTRYNTVLTHTHGEKYE